MNVVVDPIEQIEIMVAEQLGDSKVDQERVVNIVVDKTAMDPEKVTKSMITRAANRVART